MNKHVPFHSVVTPIKTIVISLCGGPGSGKSTLAAELFVKLKRDNEDVELVREFVKDWAWEGRKIMPEDQPYIVENQFKRESILYGQVEYVVTDSPLVLAPFYEQKYFGTDNCINIVRQYFEQAKNSNVEHLHFWVTRQKAYNTKGRYETEEQAIAIDSEMRNYLESKGIRLAELDASDHFKAIQALDILKKL